MSDVPSRRALLKTAAAAAVSGSVARANEPDAPDAPPPLTPDDLAAAGRTLGLDYSEKQRGQMLGIVAGRRDRYVELRKVHIDWNVEPAVHFSPRLPDTKLPTGANACALSASVEVEDAPPAEELPFLTVTRLASLIRAKKVSSTELTTLYLDRLKRVGPKLNAVVALAEERAMREAAQADEEIAAGKYRGPLHGVPYGAKDLLAADGAVTTWGIDPYKYRTFNYEATVIERLKAAGAVLVAKLSLGELAMGDVWYGGKTRNPWNGDEGSSGSSAGPAAAVAAGLVAFAIGSETLGSIVSPCVACGVTGLRPTYGRVSRFGAMPLCRTMDKLGPMTRGVEDCAAVLHAIHGPDPRDLTAIADVQFAWHGVAPLPPMRVGFDKLAFDALADKKYGDDVRNLYRGVLDTIRKLVGAELVPVALPPTKDFAGVASMTIAAESSANFTELLHSEFVHDLVQQDDGSWPNVFRAGSMIPAADYLRAQQLRTRLMHEVDTAIRDVDVMITIPFVGPQSAYTNLTGHPSLATRCGFIGDRPKTVEFVGQLYREEQVLQLGHAFERTVNANGKWPRL